jgi:hypothetical protein
MVLLTLAFLGLIAIGAKIDRWLGVAVFVVLTVAALGWLARSRHRNRASPPVRPQSRHSELRVLVVTDGSASAAELVAALRRRAAGRRAVVLVLGPAGGDDLAAGLVELRSAGLDATGEAVEGEPLPAAAEAVRRFAPDEIVVAAGVWVQPGFAGLAREQFDLPVLDVAADRDLPA